MAIISPFFQNARSAYQAELDDLTFDSDGRDVLRQRLADKRQQIDFLVNMMTLSPEMVAVVFHQGLTFKTPAALDDLLSREADELPDWSDLSHAVVFAPWARALANTVLEQPDGEWFLTVTAGLEYMAGKPALARSALDGDADADENSDGDGDDELDDELDEFDRGDNDDGSADNQSGSQRSGKARQQAGDDWMAEQGFDRKD